jgi:hypothetical protein
MYPSPRIHLAGSKYLSTNTSVSGLCYKAGNDFLTTKPSISIIGAAAPLCFRDMVVQMDPDLLLGELSCHSVEDLL